MRILHVLSQRPDSTGSGMYVQAMIKEAALKGHDNYLVAGVHSNSCDETGQCHSMFVKFNDADVSYQIPGMSDVMPYESSKFCDLSEKELIEYEDAFSKTLSEAVKTFQPDIIHSHHLWIVSSIARQLFPHIPMVTTCHGTDLRQFQNCTHLQKKVIKGCGKIDIVMALSKNQKNEISRLYNIDKKKIIIAGAGYNKTLFYPGEKPEQKQVKMVYAGKLSNAKGVPWLLRTLQTVKNHNWQLNLAGSGSGEEKERCLMLAEKLGKKVMIHGSLPQDKLSEIMRSSHILILPSFFEGLPLVILEGLASGCRVVCTDLPGVREILDGFNPKINDYVSLVKTPRLKRMDQPYKEDIETFEYHLKNAVLEQIFRAEQSPQPDLSGITEDLASFTWAGIFQKVNKAYLLSMKTNK